LVSDNAGGLWAIWSESVEDSPERLFVAPYSLQRGMGAPVLIDDRPEASNRCPAAAVDPRRCVAICWVAENKGEKRVVTRLFEPPDFRRPSVALSAPADLYAAAPRVSVDSQGGEHVVWYSDFLRGGSGDIYYSFAALR